MSLPMMRVEIIGLKADLQTAVGALHGLSCLQLDEVADAPDVLAPALVPDAQGLRRLEELAEALARVEGALSLITSPRTRGSEREPSPSPIGKGAERRNQVSLGAEEAFSLAEIDSALAGLLPQLTALAARRAELGAEVATLLRQEAALRQLLPLIPARAEESGNRTAHTVVGRAQARSLEQASRRVFEATGGLAGVCSTDLDDPTSPGLGCPRLRPSSFRRGTRLKSRRHCVRKASHSCP